MHFEYSTTRCYWSTGYIRPVLPSVKHNNPTNQHTSLTLSIASMTRRPLYPRSLLLVLLVLLNSSLISNTFDDSDFDNADTEDVKNTGCDKGHAPNKDDTCEVCYRGWVTIELLKSYYGLLKSY